MNRTISKRVFLRLTAQADEADIYGHSNIASNLTSQIVKYADGIRDVDDNENYTYCKEDLTEEVKEHLWDCATRVFDYYDETPDAKDVQNIIDFEAESFISYIESLVHKKVGAYEPEVVGEESEPEDDFVEEEDDEKFVSYDDNDDEDEDDESKEE